MNRIIRKLLCAAEGLAVLCGMLAAMPVSAADDNTFTDKTLTYEKISGGVRIISAEAGTTDISVSPTIDGYPILEIGEQAFSACSKLRTVKLPSGLKKIGMGAFSGCMSLETVNIPDTVTEIGEGAFYYCGSITELSVPDSVQTVGVYAFANCLSLKKITLPESMTELPAYAFYYDISLEDAALPNSLTSIGQMSFSACYSLKSIEIPAAVTTIEPAAFVGCSGITAYQVAEGNTAFRTDDSGAIYTTDGKTMYCYPAGREEKEYTVQAGTTELAPYACSGALHLETLNIPESVTMLGDGLFSDCQAMKSFVFPSNLTAIPESFFANSTIESVTIPDSITAIGGFAFFGCEMLSNITIPESVTEIGEEAFFGCELLHEVFVPDTVQAIGAYAFGYYLPKDAADTSQPVLMEDFSLSAKPNTQAKAYAQENGVRFRQIGVDVQIVLFIVIGAVVIVLAVLTIVLVKRSAKQRAEQKAAAPPEEPDPNYQSILDDNAE